MRERQRVKEDGDGTTAFSRGTVMPSDGKSARAFGSKSTRASGVKARSDPMVRERFFRGKRGMAGGGENMAPFGGARGLETGEFSGRKGLVAGFREMRMDLEGYRTGEEKGGEDKLGEFEIGDERRNFGIPFQVCILANEGCEHTYGFHHFSPV